MKNIWKLLGLLLLLIPVGLSAAQVSSGSSLLAGEAKAIFVTEDSCDDDDDDDDDNDQE